MTHQNDIKIHIDPVKLAKAREDQSKVDSMLGEVFDGGQKEKQVSVSDVLLEQIRILEASRERAVILFNSLPLEECQDAQNTLLIELDCSVQALKQRYESMLSGGQKEKPCTGESEGEALNQSRPLEDIKTDDLISELVLRDGIERIHTGLYQGYELRKQYSANREVISAVVLISEKKSFRS